LESLLYQLQQFDPGMVWLDKNNIITAMNGLAQNLLGDREGKLIGQEVLQIHPLRSRDKVRSLLETSHCPMDSPPPVTMMINIPERLLLIKVAQMHGKGGILGSCMIFYDLTDFATAPDPDADLVQEITTEPKEAKFSRRLLKIPVYVNKQVLLVDLKSVCCIEADGHYSTLRTKDESYFCNLSLQDLDGRLDPNVFIRTHRSNIVNISYAKALESQDNKWSLLMDSTPEISVPISRNKTSKVKELLGMS